MTDKTPKTTLDGLKEIEKRQQQILLNKSLIRLKKLCKEVLENKERTTVLLQLLGIDNTESKSIIDRINSLGSVQLTDEEKKDILDKEKNEISSSKKKVETEMEKTQWNAFTSGTGGNIALLSGISSSSGLTSSVGNTVNFHGSTPLVETNSVYTTEKGMKLNG